MLSDREMVGFIVVSAPSLLIAVGGMWATFGSIGPLQPGVIAVAAVVQVLLIWVYFNMNSDLRVVRD